MFPSSSLVRQFDAAPQQISGHYVASASNTSQYSSSPAVSKGKKELWVSKHNIPISKPWSITAPTNETSRRSARSPFNKSDSTHFSPATCTPPLSAPVKNNTLGHYPHPYPQHCSITGTTPRRIVKTSLSVDSHHHHPPITAQSPQVVFPPPPDPTSKLSPSPNYYAPPSSSTEQVYMRPHTPAAALPPRASGTSYHTSASDRLSSLYEPPFLKKPPSWIPEPHPGSDDEHHPPTWRPQPPYPDYDHRSIQTSSVEQKVASEKLPSSSSSVRQVNMQLPVQVPFPPPLPQVCSPDCTGTSDRLHRPPVSKRPASWMSEPYPSSDDRRPPTVEERNHPSEDHRPIGTPAVEGHPQRLDSESERRPIETPISDENSWSHDSEPEHRSIATPFAKGNQWRRHSESEHRLIATPIVDGNPWRRHSESGHRSIATPFAKVNPWRRDSESERQPIETPIVEGNPWRRDSEYEHRPIETPIVEGDPWRRGSESGHRPIETPMMVEGEPWMPCSIKTSPYVSGITERTHHQSSSTSYERRPIPAVPSPSFFDERPHRLQSVSEARRYPPNKEPIIYDKRRNIPRSPGHHFDSSSHCVFTKTVVDKTSSWNPTPYPDSVPRHPYPDSVPCDPYPDSAPRDPYSDSVPHHRSSAPMDGRNTWNPGPRHHLDSSLVHPHPFPPPQTGMERHPEPYPTYVQHHGWRPWSPFPHPHYERERLRPPTEPPASVETNRRRPPRSFVHDPEHLRPSTEPNVEIHPPWRPRSFFHDSERHSSFADPRSYDVHHRHNPSIESDPHRHFDRVAKPLWNPTDSEQQQPRVMSAPILGRYVWHPSPYPDFERRTHTAPNPPGTDRHTTAAPSKKGVSGLPSSYAHHSTTRTADPFAEISTSPASFMRQPFHLLRTRIIEDTHHHAICTTSLQHSIETTEEGHNSPMNPKRRRRQSD